MPNSPVTLSLSISDTNDFLLASPSAIILDENNWNLPHPISVYAPDNGSISSLGDTIQVAANGMDSVNISLKEKESENVGYISV